MNSVLLLMAFAAADGAPVIAPPVIPAAPAAPAIVSTGSSCSNCSGSVSTIAEPCGCDTCAAEAAAPARKGFFARCKEKFSRKPKADECTTCETVAAPCPTCNAAPAPCPTCNAAPVCTTCNAAPVATEMCGGCTATADPCAAPAERKGLLARLRSLCKKDKKGEECVTEAPCSTCDTCGSTGVIHSAAPHYAAPQHHAAPAPVYSPAPIQTAPSAIPSTIPSVPSTTVPAPLPTVPTVPNSYEPIAPPKEAPNKIGGLSPYPSATPVASPKDLSGANNPFDLPRQHVNAFEHSADYSSLTGTLMYVHADGGYWMVRYASIDQEDRYGGSVVLARDAEMADYREGDLISVRGDIIQEKTSTSLNSPLYRVSDIALKQRRN